MGEQLRVILVFLRRPAVWQQWLAFLLVLGLAWLLTEELRAWDSLDKRMQRRLGLKSKPTLLSIWVLLDRAVFPLAGLLLMWLAQALFRAWNRPAGLLGEWVFLFWLILVYRLVTVALTTWLGQHRKRSIQVRLLAPMVGIVALLRVLGLLIDLEAVAEAHVMTIGESPILLGPLFTTAVVLYFLFAFSWAGQAVVQRSIAPRTNTDPAMVNAVLTIARYAVIIVGVTFALGALGLDTSTVAFISGGLTVAIGFGSQQVFSNLVAGVLLLFDQSLRPGDVINVAGEIGVVENLSIRATTMRTADNVAVVMPNQSFVTGAIRNYSKSPTGVRLQIPLAVAHEGDPQEAASVALHAVGKHDKVLSDPKPAVLYTAFGRLPAGTPRTSLQLTAWLNDPLHIPEVTSELLLAVREALADHDMELV